MCEISSPALRCYERKSLLKIEEDEFHEFKGHRSISVEELPPWCFIPGTHGLRRSRKPISRAVAAFLNSGRGGTVYLGVIDEGVVKGLYLTEFQKDHVMLSIKDTFSRYRPPVDCDKYDVTFVPVFGNDEERNSPNTEEINQSNVNVFLKPHLLRTYDFCWCDKDLAKKIDEDCIIQDYVIEISIHPQRSQFKCNKKDGSFCSVLPIVYQNEEGKCFFRKSASCVEYSIQSVKELGLQQLRDLYNPIISSLRKDINSVVEEKMALLDL